MKRFVPYLVLALAAVLGLGAAASANAVLAAFLRVPEDAALAPFSKEQGPEAAVADASPKPAQRAGGLTKKQYIDTFLKRNFFEPSLASTGGGGGGESISDLDVTLLATFVALPAEFSSALIQMDGGTSRSFYVGDKIQNATVLRIERKRVLLLEDGKEKWLEVGEATARSDSRPSESASTDGEGDGQVEELGENRYGIQRSVIEEYLGDVDKASRLARALPHRGAEGDTDGFRLSGIRRNSLLRQLGVRNGDIIHSVNGKPLTSISEAMNAYQSMMNDGAFSFEITRRGQKMNLEYEVR